ncbi:MAG: ATP-binding protein [Azoarcus sp.]|jgi:predicted AAA+ superfamily ATPase|nr:ATP-binding protein [Azoarcus sp.]
MDYLKRVNEAEVIDALRFFPITALIGPRQCGKSTLARHLLAEHFPASVYLDLERPSDLKKIENAEWFLSAQRDKLVCIDEIQRVPELFPLLRSLSDEWNRPGAFLILGSASRDLLRQSSESLAGRIHYLRLSPLLWSEVAAQEGMTMERFLARGGFPRSVLATSEKMSNRWRESFIATFLERDLREWSGFSPPTMRRLWRMLAHLNGQTANYASLSASLGVSTPSVRNYVDLLAATFMVEIVPPWFSNLGKRLVKSPRIYVADVGVAASLLDLKTFDAMMAHPGFGALWEGAVLAHLKGHFPELEVSYYRTANGAEADFVFKHEGRVFALECKASLSPTLSKGNYHAFEDIAPERALVVVPKGERWRMAENVEVAPLDKLVEALSDIRA